MTLNQGRARVRLSGQARYMTGRIIHGVSGGLKPSKTRIELAVTPRRLRRQRNIDAVPSFPVEDQASRLADVMGRKSYFGLASSQQRVRERITAPADQTGGILEIEDEAACEHHAQIGKRQCEKCGRYMLLERRESKLIRRARAKLESQQVRARIRFYRLSSPYVSHFIGNLASQLWAQQDGNIIIGIWTRIAARESQTATRSILWPHIPSSAARKRLVPLSPFASISPSTGASRHLPLRNRLPRLLRPQGEKDHGAGGGRRVISFS